MSGRLCHLDGVSFMRNPLGHPSGWMWVGSGFRIQRMRSVADGVGSFGAPVRRCSLDAPYGMKNGVLPSSARRADALMGAPSARVAPRVTVPDLLMEALQVTGVRAVAGVPVVESGLRSSLMDWAAAEGAALQRVPFARGRVSVLSVVLKAAEMRFWVLEKSATRVSFSGGEPTRTMVISRDASDARS